MQVVNRRYQLEDVIGSGGMGMVYRAYDRLNSEWVALKSITITADALDFNSRLSRIAPSDNIDDETSTQLALAREFRTLSSLRHPNVITVRDYGFATHSEFGTRQPYFTMELLDQPQSLLKAGANLPLAGKIDLIAQTLNALHYLHRRGIVHRDLKPENVLVTASHVRVLDFGLAVLHEDWFAAEAGVAGTPRYLAPEILMGGQPTTAADLYAIGIMLYELFAGGHPFFDGSTTGFDFFRRIVNQPPDLHALANSPPALASLIAHLLEKRPEDRPHDAGVIHDELYKACDLPAPSTSITVRDSFLNAAAFVGREREFARLRAALDFNADATGGRFWLIGGESGIGKSRLLDELRTLALVRGLTVVRGNTVAESDDPYAMWRLPLRALLLNLPDLMPIEAGILAALIPDIQALTGVQPDFIPSMDVNAMQARLFTVAADILRRQPEKTLILLEDLQWAGEGLALLDALVPMLAETPITIVATYRSDEAPDLVMRFSEARDIQLGRLARPAIAELSESMLGASGTLPAVINLVEQETEGNIFFIVETMRTLAEEAGSLELIGVKTLPEHVFAGGMRHIMARRIERVPPAARPLLNLACVMGRTLDIAVLERAYGGENGALEPLLFASANAAILEFHFSDGWRFSHDKLREYLLSIQPADTLVTLYRQIALATEAIYPDDPSKAAALARYWNGAGEAANERRYLMTAAEQAYKLGEKHESRRLLQRLYALTDDLDELYNVLLQLSQIYYESARTPEEIDDAEKYMQQALDVANHLDDANKVVSALFLQLGFGKLRSDLAYAADFVARSEALVPRVAPDVVGKIHQAVGYLHYFRQDFEAAEAAFQKGYAVAQQTQHAGDLIAMHYLLGLTYMGMEQFERAETHFNTLLASQPGEDATLALSALGFLCLLRQQYDHAEARFREMIEYNERIRHWARLAIAWADMSLSAWLQDKLDDAETALVNAEKILRRVGTVMPQINALRWAVDAKRGSSEALGKLDALRREPGFGWGDREIPYTVIRHLEQRGTLVPLNQVDNPSAFSESALKL